MFRAPLALIALAGLALPTFAQEVEPIDDCAPETLFQAFGLEENPECEMVEEEPGDDTVGESEDETATKNPVSVAAKLPGSNREAALAHASEMSGGNAGGNGNGKSAGEDTESGSSNGNGKGNGKS